MNGQLSWFELTLLTWLRLDHSAKLYVQTQNATRRRRRNNVAVVIELNVPDGTRAEFTLDLPHLDAVAESLSSLRGAYVRSLWLNCRVEDFMQSHLQYAFRKVSQVAL